MVRSDTGKIQIRGTAHPPPPKEGGRLSKADLTRGEISTTNMQNCPLLYEHEDRIGTVLASWPGQDGSLRICADVEEPNAVRRIRDGTTRGLSLGTDMILTEDGSVISRIQKECSVCVEGKRNNTTIDTINGTLVHQVACHSKDRDSALHHIEP